MIVKNKGWSYLIIFITLLLVCGLAEADEFQVKKNYKEDNRWEAFDSQPISSRFKLIAFQDRKIPIFQKSDILNISFYTAQAGKAKISAREISKGRQKYRMEVKQINWEKGENTFKHWSVDSFLVPNNIKPNNLGLLIEFESNYYLPAFLKLRDDFKPSYEYKVYFYTPQSIKAFDYLVNDESGNKIVESQKKVPFAPKSFSVKLKLDSCKTGLYQFFYTINWASGDDSYKNEFYFYHHKEP